MSAKTPIVSGHTTTNQSRLSAYITGFVLSIVLTIIPYIMVVNQFVHGTTLIVTLVVFALLQLLIQLQFFIHLGHESGTPWNKIVFLFMMLIVFIIVVGSLWIMKNLDYHHDHPTNGSDTPYKMDDYQHYDPNFTPQQTNDFIIKDENLKQ